MNITQKPISINKQNEILAHFIMNDFKEAISDMVIAYLKEEKTFSKLFKEMVKIVNKFTKGETHKSGCSEIIAVMILNSNFYGALDALPHLRQESSLIVLPGYN